MRKILTIVIILLLLITCLSACNDKEIKASEIKSIEVRAGSLKTEYKVDEEIDFTNVYIVIKLKDDKGEVVEKVVENMLEGFDTSTTTTSTEMRSMRIKYLGVYTSYWIYTVTGAYEIDTKARIELAKETTAAGITVSFTLNMADLTKAIYAVKMDISFDTSKLTYDDIYETKLAGWDIEILSKREGYFSLVYYYSGEQASSPLTETKLLFTLTFGSINYGSGNVEINNIALSDRVEDINLPGASLI